MIIIAQEKGPTHVPKYYEVPSSERPSLSSPEAQIPVVDLAGLRMGPTHRLAVIESIGQACKRFGCYHVVNHGIDQSILDKALGAADEFFHLPADEKLKFMSKDVHKPVRYGTSLKDGVDKIQFWRVFLKHYANPLNDWVQSWPENPPAYSDRYFQTYSTGQSAQERKLSHVPECYEVPPSQQPTLNSPQAHVPVVDLAGFRISPIHRSAVIQSIRKACVHFGIFQVVNHGIDQTVLNKALGAVDGFFRLPANEKLKFMSNDVHKPVRYGTSLKDGVDKIQFWRVFLKLYANPLENWVQSWPENPPTYRENMGAYTSKVQKLAVDLAGAITESLGLGPTYLSDKIGEGMQDSLGLEIVDKQDGSWKLVPNINGALVVHIGDHFEVLSNGLYKSVVHRAIVNSQKTRISIASLHSLGLDEKMEPAPELEDADHPKAYKESSFKDFLDFLSVNDIGQGKICFLDTLKIV